MANLFLSLPTNFVNYSNPKHAFYHYKFDIEGYLRNTNLFYDDTIDKIFTSNTEAKGIVVMEGIYPDASNHNFSYLGDMNKYINVGENYSNLQYGSGNNKDN